MSYIVRTNRLTKRYGEHTAVDSVNLSIRTGDIYGFLGQNGAGKTTTLRMIMGLIRPTSGDMELFGEGGPGSSRVLERIGAIIEYPGFYLNLSAADNLDLHRRLMGIGNKEYIDDALSTVGLLDAKHSKVKGFSLGMKQRLGLARALLHRPELLVLDEPTNGLDPGGIKEMRQLFKELARQRGITFLISSHQLSEVEQLATRIGILHQGKLVEEMDYVDLQIKSRRYLAIKVDEDKKAAYVLEQQLRVSDYVVTESGVIHLYELLDHPASVTQALTSHGVGVYEIRLSGDSLEDYFIRLTGGNAHA
ncbi:ABC transporter ATP-binding protein [Paenibacillus sp. CC-CFT747]|nr:ABC transporter ATP-binding protein [Paenibacillus sp. CC-CFT747]